MKNYIKLFSIAAIAILGIQAMPNGNAKMIIDTKKSNVMWTGNAITHSHNGTIDIKEGSLLLSKEKINGGSFTIDMKSMKCTDIKDEEKNGKLLGHLKSDDFFNVEKFPTAKLVIKKIGAVNNGVQTITADLTIKDKTNSITFPATIKAEGKTMKITTKFNVDRSKFDVKYGSDSFFDNLGDKAIKNDIEFDIELVTK